MGDISTLAEVDMSNMEIEWIWGERIPRGYITLLAAKAGVGKSGFALWLANEIATDENKVLYVDAENCLVHISSRSRAWGLCNKQNIILPTKKDKKDRPRSRKIDYTEIKKLVEKYFCSLVIIDSLTAMSHNLDMKDAKDATGLMNSLSDLAMDADCGVMVLCHLRKALPQAQIQVSVDEVFGSHVFVSLARSVLLVSVDAIDNEIKILRHGKHNLSKGTPDLHMRLSESGISIIKEEMPKKPLCIIDGSKTTSYQKAALEDAHKGKSKREIRSGVKNLGGSEGDATKTIKWLSDVHGFVFEGDK